MIQVWDSGLGFKFGILGIQVWDSGLGYWFKILD